jgi:hypothetical protein
MAKVRALKDAAKDPLVKKETSIPESKKNNANMSRFFAAVIVSLVSGFIGGVAATRFFKFRF